MTIAIAQPGLGANGWLTAGYPGFGGAATSTSISYTGASANNALVVVNVGGGAPSATQPAFSVTGGTQLAQVAANDGSNNWSMVSVHVLLATSGTNVISSSNNAGAFNCYGITAACEFSGIVTSAFQDGTAGTGTGTSTTPVASNIITTGSQDLLVAGYYFQDLSTSTPTTPSGFNNA